MAGVLMTDTAVDDSNSTPTEIIGIKLDKVYAVM